MRSASIRMKSRAVSVRMPVLSYRGSSGSSSGSSSVPIQRALASTMASKSTGFAGARAERQKLSARASSSSRPMGPQEKVSSPASPVSTFTSTKLSPRSVRMRERFFAPRPRVTGVPSDVS